MRQSSQSHFFMSIFLGIAGFLVSPFSWAESVLANQFGREAGIIAGTTQACGTSITEYNSRVMEAIGVLSKTPADREAAITVYMDALSKSSDAQTKNQVIKCTQVVQSFNSLPLMRSDYKTSVLPQLASMVNPSDASSATSSPQATQTSLAQPQTQSGESPTVSQTPSTQTMVTGANK